MAATKWRPWTSRPRRFGHGDATIAVVDVRFVGLIGLVVVAGCGSVVDLDPMGADTETSTGATAATTTGAVAGSTGPIGPVGTVAVTSAGDATTGEGESDGGAGTTTRSDGSSAGSSSTGWDDPLGSVCDPQPTEPRVVVYYDDDPPFDVPHLDFQGTCTVQDVETEGDLTSFDFSCGEVSHRLGLGESENVLDVGDTVELSLFIDSPWWSNLYLKVMRDGVIELAAMHGQALPSGGRGFPPVGFFAPLSVAEQDGLCDDEEPWDGSFIGRPCTLDRRLGLAFELDGAQATVLDRTQGTVGPLEVHVGNTVNHVEVSCTDTPGAWREFLVVRG